MVKKKTKKTTPKRGNTELSLRARAWCFTLNNWTEKEFEDLKHGFTGLEYIIGKEVGENGTKHLQGYVYFPGKKTLNVLKKINNRAHWESAIGTKMQNYTYCSKEKNFISTIKTPRELKILEYEDLYEWQKEVVDLCNQDPDDRTIHWYVDKGGGCGKTTLARYLVDNHEALYVGGKAADVKYALSTGITDINNPPPIIFDLSRSLENFVSYEAIESVKNGIFFSNKYESKQMIMNSPHVIVFANFDPDKEKLSKDRWNITELVDEELDASSSVHLISEIAIEKN